MKTSLDDIRVCVRPFPGTIKAFARRSRRGRICIVVNACLDPEGQQEALQHELKHVERNDFDRDESVKLIEAMT